MDQEEANWSSITSVCEYRTLVAIPYIDSLLENIRNRFLDRSLKIVTAMSIFNSATLPSEESLSSYGNEQIKVLAGFYGVEATVEYDGETHTSKPLVDASELLSEWKIFRRALVVEKKITNGTQKFPDFVAYHARYLKDDEIKNV